MRIRQTLSIASALLLSGTLAGRAPADEPSSRSPVKVVVEEQPPESGSTKVVLIAGSSVFKPGEHDYLAACALLMDLLRQTPGVAPVLAVDWPKKSETLEGAKAVVLMFDGGDKHGLLKDDRLPQIQKLFDSGVGIVQLHQLADYPVEFGDRARSFAGAAFEKGYSQRAHWVATFATFPDHPVFRGVAPFTIDDGWLYGLRFAPGHKGVTPLLRTFSPKAPAVSGPSRPDSDIIAWAFDGPNGSGSRSLTFTGGHLHKSFSEEGYRRFLVNGILWAAHVDVPASGAPVKLDPADVGRYLEAPSLVELRK